LISLIKEISGMHDGCGRTSHVTEQTPSQTHYQKNKEKYQIYARNYREKNREKINAHQREYYANNREKIRAKQKEYCEENVEKMKAYRKKYWAKKGPEIVSRNKMALEDIDLLREEIMKELNI